MASRAANPCRLRRAATRGLLVWPPFVFERQPIFREAHQPGERFRAEHLIATIALVQATRDCSQVGRRPACQSRARNHGSRRRAGRGERHFFERLCDPTESAACLLAGELRGINEKRPRCWAIQAVPRLLRGRLVTSSEEHDVVAPATAAWTCRRQEGAVKRSQSVFHHAWNDRVPH